MELDLRGKRAILTGPAKGMGAAITRAFASEGTHLALFARDTDAVAELAAEVRCMGVEARVVACDVTDPATARAAVADVARAWDGQIDILVNIAGGTGPVGASGVETTEAEFDEIVTLNQRGPFTMIRAVAPYMQARKSGAASSAARSPLSSILIPALPATASSTSRRTCRRPSSPPRRRGPRA